MPLNCLRRTVLFCALLPIAVFFGRPVWADTVAKIQLKFDTVAVDDFVRAADRKPLSEKQLQNMVAGRGSSAMVRNTIKYLPQTPAESYLNALRELSKTGRITTDDFGMGDAIAQLKTVKGLLAAVKENEAAIGVRVAQRLQGYWQDELPLSITVYFVVGGASDGFVVDGDLAPEFYIALDKAGGDIAGLEQNITHESVHVMQRQLGSRHCPQRPAIDLLPVVDRFRTTVYEEGIANFLADPIQIKGDGEYISMWRSRYQRNDTPERMRENFWLHDALLNGLQSGSLSWDTAYQFGFYGNLDSRMYFVGREFARRHVAAGRSPLALNYVCNPSAFFEAIK